MYEKFEPGEPGLFRNAVRQLSLVLVNVPDELMYWPGAFLIATSTPAICWSSSTRPLTKIRPSVKAVPSSGENRSSLNGRREVTGVDRVARCRTGGRGVLLVRRVVGESRYGVQSPCVGRSTDSVHVVLVASGLASVALR